MMLLRRYLLSLSVQHDVAATAEACLLDPSRIRQKQAETGGAARASVDGGSSGLALSLYWDLHEQTWAEASRVVAPAARSQPGAST